MLIPKTTNTYHLLVDVRRMQLQIDLLVHASLRLFMVVLTNARHHGNVERLFSK